MPCNTSGPLDSKFFSQFGIVDVDWSHMKAVWYVHCHWLQQHLAWREELYQLVLPDPLKNTIDTCCFVLQGKPAPHGL